MRSRYQVHVQCSQRTSKIFVLFCIFLIFSPHSVFGAFFPKLVRVFFGCLCKSWENYESSSDTRACTFCRWLIVNRAMTYSHDLIATTILSISFFFRSVKFTILIWRFFMRWTCVRPLLKSKYTTEPHLNTINCNTYNAQQKAIVWLRQYLQAHTKKIIQINKNRNERSKYRKTNPVGKKMNTKLGHWLLMANDGCSHEV